MDEGTTHVGTDTLPPDRYLGPKLYRIVCRCDICGTEFSWETEKPTARNRPCPAPVCVEARREAKAMRTAQRSARMFEEQRAPPVVGQNNMVKAVDVTADVVMKDYGMTDLRDNIREGDMVAPKLPPAQQAKADNFFGTGAPIPTSLDARRAQLLRQRALAGMYRGYAVNPHIVDFGRKEGDPALMTLRKETLRE